MGPNPGLYREMAVPFPSEAAANGAMARFFEEVGELRKKHKITDVYFVVGGSVATDDPEYPESQFMAPMMYGNQLNAEPLLAYALGFEQRKRQERIGTLLSQGVTKDGKRQG